MGKKSCEINRYVAGTVIDKDTAMIDVCKTSLVSPHLNKNCDTDKGKHTLKYISSL